MTVALKNHQVPPRITAQNSSEIAVITNLLKEEVVGTSADISNLLLLHGELAKLLILIVVFGGSLLCRLLAPLARGAVGSVRGSRALAGLGGLGRVCSRLLGSGGGGGSGIRGLCLKLAFNLAEDDAG